jgi:ATP-dependent DNA helicase RecG
MQKEGGREGALPCTVLKGVGPRLAGFLANCGILTVQDLLFHLPFRYQDRTRIVPIRNLRPGDQAVIEGVIAHSNLKFGKRSSLLCRIHDGTGSLSLRFFHFNAAQKAQLVPGVRLRCYGEVRYGSTEWELIHPEYQRINSDELPPVPDSLTPIYPSTEGLHQRSFMNLTEQALLMLKNGMGLQEYLPEEILNRFKLPNLISALQYVHRPPADAKSSLLEAGQHAAQQRLAFEELLAHHLSLRKLRKKVQEHRAPAFSASGEKTKTFLKQLPFALTRAQERVVDEVSSDMRLAHPMLRLVQGDVGSGKTVIAAIAALQAIESGYQAALMAPTELLAEQHFQNFSAWLAPLGISVVYLSSKKKGKAKELALQQLAEGEVNLVVGTHALFQKDVVFAKLGLVIVDEQHRFGVHQRLALREKGVSQAYVPHQLIMTATPIPRTLAMTVYADLDNSVIDELPPGRTPVMTVVAADDRRSEVITRVRDACLDRRQVYWVCTLIEESEVLECQAAEATSAELTKALPGLRVGLVHGRLSAQEKQSIMSAFKSAEIDVLVATTVVEVGVDVPNASLMIIENSERLGLAQLHQLRGRVGRGALSSHCVLMYQRPLSSLAKSRLSVMRESNDGFEIARKDLELRGPGEVLGTRQTGELSLRVADLSRDQKLLPDIQHAAEILLNNYPEHVEPLIRRWLHQRERYGEV